MFAMYRSILIRFFILFPVCEVKKSLHLGATTCITSRYRTYNEGWPFPSTSSISGASSPIGDVVQEAIVLVRDVDLELAVRHLIYIFTEGYLLAAVAAVDLILCAAAARQVRSVLYYSLPLFGVPRELAEGRGRANQTYP